MTPAIYNIPAHTSGDDWNGMTLTITVNSGVPPYPLSSVKMQVKKAAAGSSLLEFNLSDNTIEITDSVNWIINFPKRNIALSAYTYVYDIQTIDSNGDLKTYIGGTWPIQEDVTRP